MSVDRRTCLYAKIKMVIMNNHITINAVFPQKVGRLNHFLFTSVPSKDDTMYQMPEIQCFLRWNIQVYVWFLDFKSQSEVIFEFWSYSEAMMYFTLPFFSWGKDFKTQIMRFCTFENIASPVERWEYHEICAVHGDEDKCDTKGWYEQEQPDIASERHDEGQIWCNLFWRCRDLRYVEGKVSLVTEWTVSNKWFKISRPQGHVSLKSKVDQGLPFLTSALRGEGGTFKSRLSEGGCVNLQTRGEEIKKSELYADIINGSPSQDFFIFPL